MSSGEVTAVRTVHFPNSLTLFDILMPVYTEEFPGELPVFTSVMFLGRLAWEVWIWIRLAQDRDRWPDSCECGDEPSGSFATELVN
jgi:hypothetical protein